MLQRPLPIDDRVSVVVETDAVTYLQGEQLRFLFVAPFGRGRKMLGGVGGRRPRLDGINDSAKALHQGFVPVLCAPVRLLPYGEGAIVAGMVAQITNAAEGGEGQIAEVHDPSCALVGSIETGGPTSEVTRGHLVRTGRVRRHQGLARDLEVDGPRSEQLPGFKPGGVGGSKGHLETVDLVHRLGLGGIEHDGPTIHCLDSLSCHGLLGRTVEPDHSQRLTLQLMLLQLPVNSFTEELGLFGCRLHSTTAVHPVPGQPPVLDPWHLRRIHGDPAGVMEHHRVMLGEE